MACMKWTANLLNLQGYMYQNFAMDENGAAYIKLTKELLEEFDVTASETSLLCRVSREC